MFVKKDLNDGRLSRGLTEAHVKVSLMLFIGYGQLAGEEKFFYLEGTCSFFQIFIVYYGAKEELPRLINLST